MSKSRFAELLDRYDGPMREWVREGCVALHSVCRQQTEVTANLVWPCIPFPPAPHDGRMFGKVMRFGLFSGWMEKWLHSDGIWRAYDHTKLPAVKSADGIVIRQKSLIPAYRSLIVGSRTELLTPKEPSLMDLG